MKPSTAFRLIPVPVKSAKDTMISRLAKSLCTAYRISSGDEWVVVLGDGHETNNLKAVESWVKRKLDDLDEPSARDMLNHLLRRLGDELEQWEKNQWS